MVSWAWGGRVGGDRGKRVVIGARMQAIGGLTDKVCKTIIRYEQISSDILTGLMSKQMNLKSFSVLFLYSSNHFHSNYGC